MDSLAERLPWMRRLGSPSIAGVPASMIRSWEAPEIEAARSASHGEALFKFEFQQGQTVGGEGPVHLNAFAGAEPEFKARNRVRVGDAAGVADGEDAIGRGQGVLLKIGEVALCDAVQNARVCGKAGFLQEREAQGGGVQPAVAMKVGGAEVDGRVGAFAAESVAHGEENLFANDFRCAGECLGETERDAAGSALESGGDLDGPVGGE